VSCLRTSRNADRSSGRGQLNGDEPAIIECNYWNANGLAAYLRVNRKTVYAYAGGGVIPCGRLGKRLVFSRAAIVAWLARRAAPLSTENVP
jgi:hypothetical protein